MTTDKEVRELVSQARHLGAIIRTKSEGGDGKGGGDTVVEIMVRSGIDGIGRHWMPVIRGAEVLREFIGSELGESDMVKPAEPAPPHLGRHKEPLWQVATATIANSDCDDATKQIALWIRRILDLESKLEVRTESLYEVKRQRDVLISAFQKISRWCDGEDQPGQIVYEVERIISETRSHVLFREHPADTQAYADLAASGGIVNAL